MSTDKDYLPGTFGCHEALHTTSVIAAMIDMELCSHGAIKDNPEWLALAEQAESALMKLNEAIALVHLIPDVERPVPQHEHLAYIREKLAEAVAKPTTGPLPCQKPQGFLDAIRTLTEVAVPLLKELGPTPQRKDDAVGDTTDFALFCHNATDPQLYEIYIQERLAGRNAYAFIARSEAERRGIILTQNWEPLS